MFSKGTFYTVLNAIAQLIKAVSSLIINKMIVVFLGSSALLFVGNLKSVFTILQQISGAGVYEGAVKYLSGEYKDRQTFILGMLITYACWIIYFHCFLFYSIRSNLGPFTVG